MKRLGLLFLTAFLLASLLLGCNSESEKEVTTEAETNNQETTAGQPEGTTEEQSGDTTDEITTEETTTTEEATTMKTVNDGPIEVGTYDAYDLDSYMRPFWEGRVVHNETVMFISENDQKTLLYTPDEILSVRSYDLQTEYVKGKDYDLVDGKLVLLAGSSIPCITEEVYYGADSSSSILQTKRPDGKVVYTYWGEGILMNKWQVAVTYTHSQYWQEYLQESANETYTALIEKLKKGEDATVIFYGDSITYGANASEMVKISPNTPTWTQMAIQYLAKCYGYTVKYVNTGLTGTYVVPTKSTVYGNKGTITYINTAVGGWTTQNGIDNFDTYVKPYMEQYGCDLLVVAFGMNDAGVAPANEKKQIGKITDRALEIKADTALMIVSTMVPNPDGIGWYGNQYRFESQLQKLATSYRENGVACSVMCMTSTSQAILTRKSFSDYSGNNINHPNDFMVRVYAQTFIQTLVGYENITNIE